jgi:hypothetical protein
LMIAVFGSDDMRCGCITGWDHVEMIANGVYTLGFRWDENDSLASWHGSQFTDSVF